MPVPRSLVCTAALLGAAAAVVAHGQDQPSQTTFRTEANYVRVDVYPTLNGTAVTDLRRDEIEILEDGVPQQLEQFEHVTVRGRVPQELRREPNTLAESREMLADPRARVFVLFLDTLHVDLAPSRTIRGPLVDTLDAVLGEDDLFAVMTPEMSAADLTFARRTTTVEGILEQHWWGERDRQEPADETEFLYRSCYHESIAQPMVDRRRERLALDALEDLVVFLRGVREERKAILAVTSGWSLFGPDPGLAQALTDQVPPLSPVGVDPRTGRLASGDSRAYRGTALADCERDRLTLAQVDHEVQFRELLDRANRANASFYPIDPRGLAAFDAPPGGSARMATLRMLAENTDGTAIVNTNNITGALQQVAVDLSSYYLLGYHSSNDTPDGRYRTITVRVTRPGVQVRARRGYVAPTLAEIARGDAASAPPADPGIAAERRAIDMTVGALAALTRELPLRLQAAAAWRQEETAIVWTVGEVSADEDWKSGGEADVTVVGPSGTAVATARAAIEPGTRSFRAQMVVREPVDAGDYLVRVRVRLGAGGAPLTDSATISLPGAPQPSGALLVRRGPATGNRDVATADARFRRNEQLRVEIPAHDRTPPSARLLDRAGNPLALPLSAAVTEDAEGTIWRTVRVAMAPLAPGDYVIEMSAAGTSGTTLVGFRVVR